MSTKKPRRFEKIGVLTAESTLAGISVADWNQHFTGHMESHLLELKRRRDIVDELRRRGMNIENVDFDSDESKSSVGR